MKAVVAALSACLVIGSATAAQANPQLTTYPSGQQGRTTRLLTAQSSPAQQPAGSSSSDNSTEKVFRPTAWQTRLVRSMTSSAKASTYLRNSLTGLVIDRNTGAVVWQYNAGRTRMPASTQKVLTAYTLLRSISPHTTLGTDVLLSGTGSPTIYLRGGGDPSLGATRLKALARQTATELTARGLTSVNLYLDERFFPTTGLAKGWKASYLSSDVQRVRGLTLVGYRGIDGAAAAGRVFLAYLKSAGITATVRGRSAASGSLLATTRSAPVAALLASMLSASNNDYAEYLFRQAAKAGGQVPTFAGAVRHQRRLLSADGIPLTGYVAQDGSGLSRANRMPAATMAGALRRLLDHPDYRSVAFAWGAMPRAGLTGTLRSRFASPYQACARGKVLAKTGTLNDAVGLAGLAKGADAQDRIFVLLENGRRETTQVRKALDTMATIIVGCHQG